MKKLLVVTVSAFLFAGCSPAAEKRIDPKPQETQHGKTASVVTATQLVHINDRWATVTKVSDGDTVELEGGEKVRLIGVNIPETVKSGVKPMPYGKEASNFTKSQLQGEKVFVEVDVQPKDKHGRTLAYLYLQEPKTQDEIEKYMFNAILLKEGYAQLMTIPPNVKYHCGTSQPGTIRLVL